MKNLVYASLLLLAITGCGIPQKDNTETNNLINEFRPIIQGVWDNQKQTERDLEMLKDSALRERLKRMKDTPTMCINTMDIETNEIFADKITVHVGLCNGDGTDMTLKFVPGKHTRTIQLDNDYELGYQIDSGDTSLIVYSRSKGKEAVYQFTRTLKYFPKFHN